MSDAEFDQLIAATGAARDQYFRTIGDVDADVWAPVINPKFMGGPTWPTRPAWQRIRCGDVTYIASSGLSDPYYDDETPSIGFGIEILVGTADVLPNDIRPSWLLDVSQAVSNQAADDGRFHLRLAKFGLFLFGVRMIAQEFWMPHANTEGYCGFLLGLPIPNINPKIALPSGEATMISAKLLTPTEYEFAAAHGPEGAQQLGRLFSEKGNAHLSSLRRSSVL